MRISLLIAVVAAACGRPAAGQATESLGSLSGPVSLRDATNSPHGRDGTLTLTLTAIADVDDACPDARGPVRASYRGSFAIDDSGHYRAALYPTTLTTLGGCPVTRPDVHGIASALVTAELPTVTGGWITGGGTVQDGTMNAYDGDELELGKLGDLVAPIVLDHPVDAQHRPL